MMFEISWNIPLGLDFWMMFEISVVISKSESVKSGSSSWLCRSWRRMRFWPGGRSPFRCQAMPAMPVIMSCHSAGQGWMTCWIDLETSPVFVSLWVNLAVFLAETSRVLNAFDVSKHVSLYLHAGIKGLVKVQYHFDSTDEVQSRSSAFCVENPFLSVSSFWFKLTWLNQQHGFAKHDFYGLQRQPWSCLWLEAVVSLFAGQYY